MRSSSGPRFLPRASQHRGDRRRALGGEVAGEAAGAVQGGVELEEAVLEAFAGRVVVGVGGAPGFVGGLGDDPQPVQVRPGLGGFEEDLVGVLLHVLVADLAGPGGHLPRPRDRDGAVGGGVVQQRVPAEEAHCADGGLGVFAAQAGAAGEPGGGGGVAVAVVGGVGVEPAQQPVLRGGQPGLDRADRDEGLPAGGPVQVPGGRGVEVVDGRPGGAQRLRHAGEPRAALARRRVGRRGARSPALPGQALSSVHMLNYLPPGISAVA